MSGAPIERSSRGVLFIGSRSSADEEFTPSTIEVIGDSAFRSAVLLATRGIARRTSCPSRGGTTIFPSSSSSRGRPAGGASGVTITRQAGARSIYKPPMHLPIPSLTLRLLTTFDVTLAALGISLGALRQSLEEQGSSLSSDTPTRLIALSEPGFGGGVPELTRPSKPIVHAHAGGPFLMPRAGRSLLDQSSAHTALYQGAQRAPSRWGSRNRTAAHTGSSPVVARRL